MENEERIGRYLAVIREASTLRTEQWERFERVLVKRQELQNTLPSKEGIL